MEFYGMCVLQTLAQELNGVQFFMVTKLTDYGSLFFLSCFQP